MKKHYNTPNADVILLGCADVIRTSPPPPPPPNIEPLPIDEIGPGGND